MDSRCVRLSVLLFAGIFLLTSIFVPAAGAKMIGTSMYLDRMDHHSPPTEELQTLLTREDVREKLVALGVNPDDAARRIAALTPEEAAALQKRIHDLPAGSGVLSVLGVVLVVLIVLELVGVTNIFTKM